MTYSGALRQPLYQPTLLEMARAGNFQAIAFWMNSLLEPQGIYAEVSRTQMGRLKIQLHFLRPGTRDGFYQLRERVVRFICYRLWTLNSSAIDDVWIVARRLGDPEVLWRQAVRIATPANEPVLRRRPPARRRSTARYRFQVFRAVLMTGLTTSGFFLGYWLFYLRVMGTESIPEGPRPAVAMLDSGATAGYASGQNSGQNSGQGSHQSSSHVQRLQPSLALLNQRITKPGNPGNQIPQAFQGQVVYSVALSGQQKLVALTFDDGPWQGSTERVLDVLKQHNVQATFFVTGRQVKQFPDMVRRLVSEGHAIGNHTWNHPIHEVEAAIAQTEIESTRRIIQQVTGIKTMLFRPPGGNLNTRMVEYAKQQNQSILMWSSDSEDYYVGAPLVIDNVLRQVRPGGIVLMHDGGGDQSATVQALPQIIQALQQQGYRFVTIPELMEAQSQRMAVPTATPSPAGASPEPIEVGEP